MNKLVFGFFLFLTACMGNSPNVLIEQQIKADEVAEKYGCEFTLPEVLRLAKERNLDLQIAKLKQEIASIDKYIAVGNLLPQVNILAGYEKNYDSLHAGLPTRMLGLPYNMQVTVLDEDFYAYSLNAQLPVFVPSLWFLMSARQKGEDIQNLLTSLSEKLISLKVMSEYFYVLALQSEEKNLQNDLLASKELFKQVEISLRTESVLPWELEQAKAFVMLKEVAVNRNRREQENARLRILQSLNFPFDTEFSLLPVEKIEREIPSLEDCIVQALERNEKWKIHDLSMQVQADIKKIAISNFLPKIILGGTMFSFDNRLIAENNTQFFSVMGLLSVFNGFKNVNEYRKALRQQKISEIELVKEYWALIAEVQKAYYAVSSAKELFIAAKTGFSAAHGKKAQKFSEKKYDMIDFKEYYDALQEYYSAESFYKKSYFQYRLALGTLAVAMGKNPYDWN